MLRISTHLPKWVNPPHRTLSRSSLPLSLAKKTLSTAAALDLSYDEAGDHWRSLTLALDQLSIQLSQPYAREMEMDEASETKDEFDKVLLLINQGQAGIDKNGQYGLTRQGIGSVLDLSRKTAIFCTDETQLIPGLVLVAPTKPAMHTALLSFPQYSPQAATRRPVQWMCRSDLVEHAEQEQLRTTLEVDTYFPGMDLSGHYVPLKVAKDALSIESKLELLQQSENFLMFLQSRNEQVVAVSSHCTWLQAFCGFSLMYEPRAASLEGFRTAEIRAVGIRFGK